MQNFLTYSVRLLAVAILLQLWGTHPLMAYEHSTKNAILLVAFGTSMPGANVSYNNIEEEVRKAFPNEEIRWAYSSKFIRKKLKKQGTYIDSPAEALAKLGEDGFTHVAVQSLNSIPGIEHDNIVKTVTKFNNMPKGIEVAATGAPLLSSHEDILAVTKALLENIPEERKAKEAVLYMGHGSHHTSNIYYPGLQYYLSQTDANAFIGTVEGYPTLNNIIPTLKKQKVKKVWLIPFMAVAGDHAKNDMAGPEEDSWKSILEKEGFEVDTVLKGTAEYDNVVQVWVKHLKEVFKKL